MRRTSRTAHQQAVRVARQMSIPVTRTHPDHPSVVRITAMFTRQRHRADPYLRRLTDLFRETEPVDVGTVTAAPGYGGYSQPQHRCSELGQVGLGTTINPTRGSGGGWFNVIVCRHHRYKSPGGQNDYNRAVGASWLRSMFPAKYAEWKAKAYTPAALSEWQRSVRAERKGRVTKPVEFHRVRPYIVDAGGAA